MGTTLADYDFLVLPTCFENFGHVIVEALTAACPVVLSDTTSWRGLESKRAGFDVPLSDMQLWTQTLQRCVDMGEAEHLAFRTGAVEAGGAFADVEGAIAQSRSMLDKVASGRTHGG